MQAKSSNPIFKVHEGMHLNKDTLQYLDTHHADRLQKVRRKMDRSVLKKGRGLFFNFQWLLEFYLKKTEIPCGKCETYTDYYIYLPFLKQ